jgi:hypothetical protein
MSLKISLQRTYSVASLSSFGRLVAAFHEWPGERRRAAEWQRSRQTRRISCRQIPGCHRADGRARTRQYANPKARKKSGHGETHPQTPLGLHRAFDPLSVIPMSSDIPPDQRGNFATIIGQSWAALGSASLDAGGTGCGGRWAYCALPSGRHCP